MLPLKHPEKLEERLQENDLHQIAEPDCFPEYLFDMSESEAMEDYFSLLKTSRQNYEDTGCRELLDKNVWQMNLITVLHEEPTPKFIEEHGNHFSNLYCAFSCENPCANAVKAAKELLPIYERRLDFTFKKQSNSDAYQ